MKKNNDDGIPPLWFYLFVGIFFVVGLFIGATYKEEPQGIGGFVYQEIEWADQTYNIIKENCDNGNYLGGIYHDANKNQLFCYHEECKGEYCKNERIYFPVVLDDR